MSGYFSNRKKKTLPRLIPSTWHSRPSIYASCQTRNIYHFIGGIPMHSGIHSPNIQRRLNYVHLFNCSLTRISNLPITWQQLNAFRHVDIVETIWFRVQTRHQNGEERWLKWLWTWHGCWRQTDRFEYFRNCWSTGISKYSVLWAKMPACHFWLTFKREGLSPLVWLKWARDSQLTW